MNTNHFDITTPAALIAMAQQDKIDLTPGQAKMLTKAIKDNLNTLPAYILICLKGKAYRAMGYKSVAEWALAEFGLSRSRIYQLNAVASAEHAIRERFNLSASFTLSEGNFRPLQGDIENVLSRIDHDLDDADLAADAPEPDREKVVNRTISQMLRELEALQRALSVSARGSASAPAAAISDITSKPETASANNVYAITPRSESSREISAVPLTYELAVVKARDTGKVLMCLSPDADADLLRDALMDAQAVIAELLPFVAAAAA